MQRTTWYKLTYDPEELAKKLGIKGHIQSVQGLLPRIRDPSAPDYNRLEKIIVTIEGDDEPF